MRAKGTYSLPDMGSEVDSCWAGTGIREEQGNPAEVHFVRRRSGEACCQGSLTGAARQTVNQGHHSVPGQQQRPLHAFDAQLPQQLCVVGLPPSSVPSTPF